MAEALVSMDGRASDSRLAAGQRGQRVSPTDTQQFIRQGQIVWAGPGQHHCTDGLGHQGDPLRMHLIGPYPPGWPPG